MYRTSYPLQVAGVTTNGLANPQAGSHVTVPLPMSPTLQRGFTMNVFHITKNAWIKPSFRGFKKMTFEKINHPNKKGLLNIPT